MTNHAYPIRNTSSFCKHGTFFDHSKVTVRVKVKMNHNVMLDGDTKDNYKHVTGGKGVISSSMTKDDTHPNIMDEISDLKERIKSIWDNVSDKTDTVRMAEQTEVLTVTEMLSSIEMSMKNNKSKLKRQLAMREEIKYQRSIFKNLYNVINEESESKTSESGYGNSRRETVEIVETFKRWKTDRHQLIRIVEPLLQDVMALLTTGPLHSLMPKQFATEESNCQVSPMFQQMLSRICCIKQCLADTFQNFQKKFVTTELFVELQEDNKRLNCDINKLQTEKDELLNRLSKVAGANLTDNNPNIADLSDPNRATKLAEQFSELYDNEWTDAFEDLKITDEKECIAFLLNILVESYKMCGTISCNQQSWLANMLRNPTECLSLNTKVKQPKDEIILSKVQSRSLAELRKMCAELSVADVKMFIATKYKQWVSKEHLEIYTLKCIELCWLMHLQTPPVYLDYAVTINSTFDTNKYKPYTKSGLTIDYQVWPVLLLHKDGPLLCKGVAQGK
ncbi:uncharacterized protein LOC132725156 isoform X2 [Ruditapes philippinarum]|nr:uncharacterized protein LOC132725156 isoform X2 [Ruditapes philippinarum]XP_060566227.1 uncharacterized protein LOC132725156 isoform X2 [Ruditapes philippinarum]